MKRIRLDRVSNQLLAATSSPTTRRRTCQWWLPQARSAIQFSSTSCQSSQAVFGSGSSSSSSSSGRRTGICTQSREKSTQARKDDIPFVGGLDTGEFRGTASGSGEEQGERGDEGFGEGETEGETEGGNGWAVPPSADELPLPSPHPSNAARSAKLAALHARLSLSPDIPLQTLARTLVDPSADSYPKFNNANMAYIGYVLFNYYASEYLMARYPRLPLAIMFNAAKGYVGTPVLHNVARAWGVEAAAAPGEEVDPGFLQFDPYKATVEHHSWGYIRADSEEQEKYKWNRSLSSRVVYDDAFGDKIAGHRPRDGRLRTDHDNPGGYMVSDARNTKENLLSPEEIVANAHANFVRALVGAVYLHCGRAAVKTFVRCHFMSRELDLSNMFEFEIPTRELSLLCAREDFDLPVARLESETGRRSRTPIYVVGIYSGRDKLGEGTGASLDDARVAAAINSLKSWYLYSPGEVNVPSDSFVDGAKTFKPLYVDIGEVISW